MNSGQRSAFKIECDALTDEEWGALAAWAADLLPPFGDVEGVPRGGLKLAAALERHRSPLGSLLIVDDVLTTGGCMERWRKGRDAIGLVVFARGVPPAWVTALFSMPAAIRGVDR